MSDHSINTWGSNLSCRLSLRGHTFVPSSLLPSSPPQVTSLNDILADYNAFGGVSFHWILLSGSGHDRRPKGAVVDAYQSCLPRERAEHKQIKTFLNTGSVQRMLVLV